MTSSATYIGLDGKDGYRSGQKYTLLTIMEGKAVRILIAAPGGTPKTYNSVAAFDREWQQH
jgi:hypothetical protein